MTKLIVLASLLAASLAASAQTAASSAAPATPAASAPKHKLHAPKLRKGATPATNPETTPDKKGGA